MDCGMMRLSILPRVVSALRAIKWSKINNVRQLSGLFAKSIRHKTMYFVVLKSGQSKAVASGQWLE
jgi:hypothetical protein